MASMLGQKLRYCGVLEKDNLGRWEWAERMIRDIVPIFLSAVERLLDVPGSRRAFPRGLLLNRKANSMHSWTLLHLDGR